MRLSRDGDSWKAGGVKRRDFRHTHDGPDEPPHRSKAKDGKRWCRGKVGREHNERLVQGRYYDHYACAVCGKKSRYIWRPWR